MLVQSRVYTVIETSIATRQHTFALAHYKGRMGVMGNDGEEVKGGLREGFNGWLHNSYCLESITNLLVVFDGQDLRSL